ncbi:MAG: GFA family protein [Sphingomonadaceae bacterium]|nr:GFA family protein [Sphingomonadaceae bacterium]
MTTIREARCACGALSLRAGGDPVRISVCHCLDCKRRTGSAFAWNATYESGAIAVDGTHATWHTTSDEGFWARHHFCPACGVYVFYEIERRPGMISVPAGAFADPDFPPPRVDVYEERRCPWLPELPLPHE